MVEEVWFLADDTGYCVCEGEDGVGVHEEDCGQVGSVGCDQEDRWCGEDDTPGVGELQELEGVGMSKREDMAYIVWIWCLVVFVVVSVIGTVVRHW